MTFRYAWRSLAKSPAFVAIAVIALGVGLGLSTTMFAVMDAVLHPYQPYKDPETLFSINWWFGKRRPPMTEAELYRYIRDNTRSFSAVMAVEGWGQVVLQTPNGQEDVRLIRIPARYFPVTGMSVELGRPFRAGDGEEVVVVGRELWRKVFGRQREIGDATVRLSDRVYRIVGVMPEGECGMCARMPNSPGIESGSVQPTSSYLRPYVRLKPGVTREEAQTELRTLAQLLSDRHGVRDAPFAFDLTPRAQQREELRDLQKAMIGAALLVLLIACVNLAHLLLARGLARQRDLAVHMALGATRARVVRQMFTECAIITVAGAALGAVITLWGTDLLQNRMPREVAWVGLVRPQLSWRVFGLAAGAAAVSVVVFGLLPAIKVALGVNLDEPLKNDSGTTTGRMRQRYSPLVVSEVALALVLLMGGALLLRTLQQLTREELNFETRTLYQGWTWWRRGPSDTLPRPSRRVDMLATARGVPGVADVAFQTMSGLRGGGISAERTGDSAAIISARSFLVVTPNFITVLGLPILRGRNFEPGDAAGTGVAIVDPVAAERLYGRQDAVGRMVKLGGPFTDAPWVPIVGVMRSPTVLESNRRGAAPPMVLVCRADTVDQGTMILRLTADDPRIPATLQSRLRSDVGVSVGIYPFDYERRAELISRGFLAKVFVGMGVVALGLSALGLYGVLAYAVSRRRREFAVRVALGAEPKALLRMVFHDGAVMLLAGTGVGAFAALAASRYLDAVLVSVLPSDVIALVLSEAVLLAVGFAAATAPARRAAKANPLDILRAV